MFSELEDRIYAGPARHRVLEVFGLYVRVAEQENIERALRRFKKQVQKAGILSDYRRKKFFESPSERRKRKAAAARRRQVKRSWHRDDA